ncbi:MAG TPA: hypothetical protein VGR37_20015 [Longimicrobiaceae bacterium]|nr:hypothetical protein [Longimicrobiaceae bacterium]
MSRDAGGPRYAAGVGASLVAEVVFIAVEAIVSLVRGMDPWMAARMPGALALGPGAVQPPGFVPGDVAVGLLTHLGLGIVVGLVYAALLPRLGISPLVGGLIAGAVLYGLGFWLLPLLFPAWLAPFWVPPVEKGVQAATHAVYGVVFGWAYRRLAR